LGLRPTEALHILDGNADTALGIQEHTPKDTAYAQEEVAKQVDRRLTRKRR
jgi:hypothetical protein